MFVDEKVLGSLTDSFLYNAASVSAYITFGKDRPEACHYSARSGVSSNRPAEVRGRKRSVVVVVVVVHIKDKNAVESDAVVSREQRFCSVAASFHSSSSRGGQCDSKRVKLSFVVDETKGYGYHCAWPRVIMWDTSSQWAYLGFPPFSSSFATTKPFLPASSSFSPSFSSPFSSRKRSHGGKVIVVIMPCSLCLLTPSRSFAFLHLSLCVAIDVRVLRECQKIIPRP